jgi:SAM-dependent methyltransferase
VVWLRQQPDQQALVRACYYDDPLLAAAQRFARSDEWLAVRAYLPHFPGLVIDIGAGRGISSYALARDGWQVVALEPDPSILLGARAIRDLMRETSLPIMVGEAYGEAIPFEDNTFDLVYGREVLHHAKSLNALCMEAARVLKPGGLFIATREHVITKRSDLRIFLDNHPLHKLYGGENAFLLSDYITSISGGGLEIQSVLSPLDSWINTFSVDRKKLISSSTIKIRRWFLKRLPRVLASRLSRTMKIPGRLYSFVAYKPIAQVFKDGKS